MKPIGNIKLDNEGYIRISWEGEIGERITENNLQDKANDICDLVVEILENIANKQ